MENLPAGTEELLRKSVADLEAEFRRVTSKSRMPPSAVRQLFESYALQIRLVDAAQRETSQRTFLVNAIVAYRNPGLQLQPGEELPLSELTQIALTMPLQSGSYADALPRQETLDNLLQQYETFETEDREFYGRLALADFIKGNRADAGDPDRKSTRLNSSHIQKSRMPSSA